MFCGLPASEEGLFPFIFIVDIVEKIPDPNKPKLQPKLKTHGLGRAKG
jgi:hypothetical protein